MSKLSLAGIRITDFSTAMVGPHGTKLLALMGAEVIKIESRAHLDIARNIAYTAKSYGNCTIDNSPVFSHMGINKLSVRLNLQRPEAKEIVKRIIKMSDVVVENARPGVMGRLGLDYVSLKQIKPDIIMVSQSAFGQVGPESKYAGYASTFAALGGLSYLAGYADQAPTEYRSPADSRGGFFTALAVLLALCYRQRTGRGQHVDSAIQECSAYVIGDIITDYTMNGRVQSRNGNRDSAIACHNCHPCKERDSWVSIVAADDGEWARLCQAMGQEPLIKDARFADALARYKNQETLDRLIGGWTKDYTPQQVTEILQKKGVAAFPVMSNKDLAEDPHLNQRGVFTEVSHEGRATVTTLAPPFRLSKTPLKIKRASPNLGEDDHYVFHKLLGMTQDEIAGLEAQQVIY